jgi:hypothetical protein
VKVSVEKPGSPDELVHVGVAGMKWGVRRSKQTREFRKKFPTRAERDLEISRARTSAKKQKMAVKSAGGTKTAKGSALQSAYLKNPDRVTARRLKSGEKLVAALAIPLVPGVGLVTVGVAAGVNASLRRGLESANSKRK